VDNSIHYFGGESVSLFSLYSKGCAYVIRALICVLKENSQDRFLVKEVCRKAQVPEAYTRKILQQLAQSGFLRVSRGPGGGYRLNRPASEISLLELIRAVEGPDNFEKCIMGFAVCEETEPCPVHDIWSRVKGNGGNRWRSIAPRKRGKVFFFSQLHATVAKPAAALQTDSILQKQKARLLPGFLCYRSLKLNDVGRLVALGALSHFEFDLLAFFQGLVAITLNRCVMNKHITSAFAGNKTVTFRVVEPLDMTFWHNLTFLLLMAALETIMAGLTLFCGTTLEYSP